MTSLAKSSDFLSELKATLSKLTARDESDSAQNGTDRVEAAQEMAAVDRSRYQNDGNADRRADRPGETGGGLCRRSVLYGELSSVLEKRGQQQQQQRRQLSDLESRLKPGKSIVYLGSGPRRDALLAAADAATPRRNNDDGGDAAVTSTMTSSVGPRAEEEEDEEDTTDVTSTSSGDGGGGASPAGEHGNRDSACVMSADDSASDCSLLIADPPPPQQQPQSEDAEKCRRESVSTAPQQQQQQQQVMAVLSDEEDACRRRRDRQRHFATFPLIRPAAPTLTPPPASRLAAPDDQVGGTRSVPVAPIHDDVITTLMITHSGEPISVGLSHHDPIQVGVSDM